MKRTIYSLYIDVPENEHFGKSIAKYDTVDKALITRNAFKEHYHKLIKCKKDYANNIDPLDVRFDDRDTIMSYRDSACNPPEEDYFLTELDIKALRTLWGVEKK